MPTASAPTACPPGQTITLILDHYTQLKSRRPDLLDDIAECVAFVNWRRVQVGEPALFCIAHASSP